MGIEAETLSRVVQIEKKAPYSMEDDFLNNTANKTISEVADEDSCASFIMYETVGSDYLNISASDLRTKHIMKGGGAYTGTGTGRGYPFIKWGGGGDRGTRPVAPLHSSHSHTLTLTDLTHLTLFHLHSILPPPPTSSSAVPPPTTVNHRCLLTTSLHPSSSNPSITASILHLWLHAPSSSSASSAAGWRRALRPEKREPRPAAPAASSPCRPAAYTLQQSRLLVFHIQPPRRPAAPASQPSRPAAFFLQ
ncbi:hypothetical protein PIB30_101679, partial [Stylosanthes scabra]|nr:hypothetical protein [Stylosanthes scabra]